MESRKVANLFVFGSALYNDNPNDIDLLIELKEDDPLLRGELLIELWDYFENYFGKKVDLITPQAIKNPVFEKELQRTKKLIYAEGQQEVSA
ncbi:MAG: nucleotidyltransferase domain-containing protein [Ekhidna sp.]|nr:nucleotidyltransferase domain-containing protein [Ekhidna sp.]